MAPGPHIRDLARGGLHVYGFAPAAVQVFFVALVILDPLVFVLVLAARPAAAWLAAAVMAADIAANWFVNVSAAPGYRLRFLPASGLLLLTAFGVLVLITFVPLGRSLREPG